MSTAGVLKRALKEIHALGGDYVQVLTGSPPVERTNHGDVVISPTGAVFAPVA